MVEKHTPFDPEAQKAAEAKQAEATRLLRDREVDDFKWLMGHRQGRSFVWRLLGMTRLHHTPHVMGESSEDNAFRAGAQNIGQMMQAEIHLLCPDRYIEMQQEHVEWQRKHNPQQ